MRIPYVIDNIEARLADVLNALLRQRAGQKLDIATAYFSVHGFAQVRAGMGDLGGFRLLLGADPQDGAEIGMRPDSAAYLRRELNAEAFSAETLRLVEDLVRFLSRDDVQVRLYTGRSADGSGGDSGGDSGRNHFLHAKCYLFYGAPAGGGVPGDMLYPFVGIVGSSNFTAPGLVTSRELNLVHKTLLDAEEVNDAQARVEVAHASQSSASEIGARQSVPDAVGRLIKSEVGARAILDLAAWYNGQWELAGDYKQALIELLENSKFGQREYTPYQIYMKALYEYMRDDLNGATAAPSGRSAVELAEFQEDAVRKARRILAQYDGVIVADSVGLGKTWIGKKLLEDYAYHQRQKALVICPASLRAMWDRELKGASISAHIVSQEMLASDEFDALSVADVDVVLVDEAHNFRNRRAKRYLQLESLLAANGRRGRDGQRKKMILLTATPINNNLFDLYNQINLFAGNDKAFFASAGIGDLYKYFLAARKESIAEGSVRIFNLLEEVVIRRTRQFIRRAYPEATIQGKQVRWPGRRLRTITYDLQATYEGIYRRIIRQIETLNLAQYKLEDYLLDEKKKDDWELGRQDALVGIFISRFLKRLESSIDAFRISIRRALEFTKTFAEYANGDVLLDASSFNQAMRLLNREDDDEEEEGENEILPASLAAEMDASDEARAIIATLPRLDPSRYDRRRLHHDLQHDIDALTTIWNAIREIRVDRDAKLRRLKDLLEGELRGQKVLVFTYYKDTSKYLYSALTGAENAAWRESAGNPVIRRIDSGVKVADRQRLVRSFAPVANGHPAIAGTEEEINVLISTDVLSEGQNLQDCGVLINYDLHWNPTRMVQRAGRVDRLGSTFEELGIYNMFPEKELEDLLGILARLTKKIEVINESGFLDASVLGEVVSPRDFNTLRKIRDEDGTVIEEQESFLELASSEAIAAELQRVLGTEAREWLTDLDDGIHSGLYRHNARGVFFYFTAPRQGGRAHFWRYYDMGSRKIIDNRYQIMELIRCAPDTPRYPPPYDEIDVFALQEKVIDGIVSDVEQQEAVALVGKSVAVEQVNTKLVLGQATRGPAFDRAEIAVLRKFLDQPLVGASVLQLRNALNSYSKSKDIAALVGVVRGLHASQGAQTSSGPSPDRQVTRIKREDLHLVCFEFVIG